jgi:methionyl-tRNA formyltransferase
MRLGFMGTPGFAVPTLRALHAAGHEIAFVVAQPDRPAGRGQALRTPPVAVAARELGLRVEQPSKIRSGPFPELWRELSLEVAVVVAYGRILTPELLRAPARGCVNVHASLLPRWRGAAPIQRAILAGDATTGITTMQMDEGLDTGDILLQEEIEILRADTGGTLHDRLSEVGARLAVRTLDEWPPPRPQPVEGVTHAPMLERAEGAIDWSADAIAIERKVRGLSPWPGTTTSFRGALLKLLSVALATGEIDPGPHPPGTLLGQGIVACGRGAIRLREVQLAGRKPVSGADFEHGARLRPGERFQ